MPQDFHRQPFIALGNEISTRSDKDRFFADHGIKPCVVAEAQLSFAICSMVAAGAGVSIIEPVTARQCAGLGMVAIRPITPEQPFTYDMLTPALRPASRLVQDLADRVRRRLDALKQTA